MSNLGPREKYGIILLGIVLIVFGMYMLGIRNLEKSYGELCATRDNLVAQKEYYDNLKAENEEMQAQIEELNSKISDVENSFIPEVNTESIEQYVLSVFEEKGCPYLVSVESSDLLLPQVVMPDGSLSQDKVVIKRIAVQYSTTDGVNIGEYNRDVSVILPDGTIDEAALDALVETMVWNGSDSRQGYDEFLDAIIELANVDPDCIKINKIAATSQNGYILLDAEIDFYAAAFTERVSEPNTTAPYVAWSGNLNVNTDGGFIGMPFIVDNPASEWYSITLTPDEAGSTDRPFATYYSAALWQTAVSEGGVREALGVEDGALSGPGGSGADTPNDQPEE